MGDRVRDRLFSSSAATNLSAASFSVFIRAASSSSAAALDGVNIGRSVSDDKQKGDMISNQQKKETAHHRSA
jgi:hypothetical protein